MPKQKFLSEAISLMCINTHGCENGKFWPFYGTFCHYFLNTKYVKT